MATNGKDGPGGAGAFARRLLLSVDAKGYGGADTVRQHQFQEAIVRLLELASDAAGLNREKWLIQEGGDSLFAVLPEGASEPALVDAFMRSLEASLRAFNIGRETEAWLRLRAAVHFGETSPAANGFAGSAPVEIGRIRDCAALRAALDQLSDARWRSDCPRPSSVTSYRGRRTPPSGRRVPGGAGQGEGVSRGRPGSGFRAPMYGRWT